MALTAFTSPRAAIGSVGRQVLEPERTFSNRGVFAVFDTWSGGWTTLAVVAIVGSLVYGATLALVLPHWPLDAAAVWLTFSAGFAWQLLGLGLVGICRRHVLLVAHACLVTMSWGVAINLAIGIVNLILWCAGLTPGAAGADDPGPLFALPAGMADLVGREAVPLALAVNLALLVVCNAAMLGVLVAQFRVLGVAWWRPTLAWLLLLNGGGIVGGIVFYDWLIIPAILRAAGGS